MSDPCAAFLPCCLLPPTLTAFLNAPARTRSLLLLSPLLPRGLVSWTPAWVRLSLSVIVCE